ADTVARFGGDEFVVLVRNVGGEGGAAALTRRIGAAVADPVLIGGQAQVVTASLGLARAGDRHRRAGDLLREADAAMYRAKHAGGNRQVVFTDSMLAEDGARLRIEDALRGAVARRAVTRPYQPVVSR